MKREKSTADVKNYPPMIGPINLFGLAVVDPSGGADIPMIPTKPLLDPLADDDMIPSD